MARSVLVDSNVLLDIATADPVWGAWSAETLAALADEAAILINPVIYAEVSVGFDRIEELDAALPDSFFVRTPLPYAAAFLAGKAFWKYRRLGGARTSPLPDFYIGAHAAIAGLRLLTRDTRRYRTYFPSVELVAPP